jgi:glycosyltransferase involved in cell wall biosynthesis
LNLIAFMRSGETRPRHRASGACLFVISPSVESERSGLWDGTIDWVTAAVRRGRGARAEPDERDVRLLLRESRELLEAARRDGAFRGSLPLALELVSRFPMIEGLQTVAARLILEGGDAHHALVCWRAILDRFPTSIEAFRLYIRLVRRLSGIAAATAILDERFQAADLPNNAAELIMFGYAHEELGLLEEAEGIFEAATRVDPDHALAWRVLAKLRQDRGALSDAERALATGAARTGDSKLVTALTRLRRNIQTLEGFAEKDGLDNQPMSISAANFILRHVLPERRGWLTTRTSLLGSTLLIGGSLGSGGAERQMVTTALGLQRAANTAVPIEGVDVVGPIQVCVRSLNPQLNNDFFAAALREADLPTSSYMDLEPYGGRVRVSGSRDFCAAIDFLPPRMSEGMTHLVDYLRNMAPDVVHIWQDGMILAAGLAALVARVPRIILTTRTMPPTERLSRWRLELEPMLRSLLQAPGVLLTSNSAAAARAYERWLGLPSGAVPVIPNGVPAPDQTPSEGDTALWSAFQARIGGGGFVVGGVMRIDDNKRPFDWLDIAARVHAVLPTAAFVLVGDGRMSDEAQEYAARLGLHDRVLFTGRSRSVGYWLSKMDVMLLTSRFEGTPNVLIEAQMAGVPVITTPAGGAAETLRDGVTGYVLSSLVTIDSSEAAARLLSIAHLPAAARQAMAEAAQVHARTHFSVENMLARTVTAMTMDLSRPMLPSA